jgi:hypothetical protein
VAAGALLDTNLVTTENATTFGPQSQSQSPPHDSRTHLPLACPMPVRPLWPGWFSPVLGPRDSGAKGGRE